jgi:hypothetical protein
MKKYSAALVLAVVSFLALAGCGDDPASSNTTNGSIGAKVNGSSWSATNIQATWTNNVLGLGGSRIQGADNHQINITGMISAPGTYQLNPFAGLNATYTEGSAANVKIFTVTSGQIVVTELSSSGAKGTFSFNATQNQGSETRSITEGTFDVKF